MERGNVRFTRMARAMPFSPGLPKDQSRGKWFDKAPRFALKGKVSASLQNQLIQTGNPNDHKPISDFQLNVFSLAACFFVTASFDGFCRYRRGDCLLAVTRGSCGWRWDGPVS